MDVRLEDLSAGIAAWMDRLGEGLPLGRFRFCVDNSEVPTGGILGQMATCFAMKIAWQTRLWDQWPDARKRACIGFVQSFQVPSGQFVDHWLIAATRPRWRDWVSAFARGRESAARLRSLIGRRARNIRAETRQSAATLMMVGARPRHKLPSDAETVEEVKAYLRALDWSDPWSAGSHLSHLAFMLTANYTHERIPADYPELVGAIIHFLDSIRDPFTGTWFTGNPSETVKINGAMKILSGLQWLSVRYPDCRQLLDFALNQPFQSDGCGFLNRLLVVHHSRRGVPCGHRQTEIRDLAQRAIGLAMGFRKPDGGFSFFETGSQTHYYGAPVSNGLPVSDLHGTMMMTWAIALSLEMLDQQAAAPGNLWRAHRP